MYGQRVFMMKQFWLGTLVFLLWSTGQPFYTYMILIVLRIRATDGSNHPPISDFVRVYKTAS